MMEIFSMGIIRFFKRFFYKVKNSDPVRNCPVYKNEWCALVDSPYCDVKNCNVLKTYMGDKWIGCAACLFQDACSSNNFGLGCSEGVKELENNI